MDLLTVSLALPLDHTSTHDSIADLVTSRLKAIPGVEHVRTRVDGNTLGIGVFVTPNRLAILEPALQAEFAQIAHLLAGPDVS